MVSQNKPCKCANKLIGDFINTQAIPPYYLSFGKNKKNINTIITLKYSINGLKQVSMGEPKRAG